MGSIFIISIFFLLFCPSWDEVLEESRMVVVDFAPDFAHENDDAAESEAVVGTTENMETGI